MSKALVWLIGLMKPYKGQAFLGSFLVALTILFNTGLLATAAVLLSRAAFKPPILWLMTLIVGVRFFGIGRAVLRYSERLINHAIAFKILGKLRADVYALIEPLVPDPLEKDYDKAKLYNRLMSHIEVLQYFYLRVVSVPLGTFFVGLVIGSWLFVYSLTIGLVFCFFYSVLLFALPLFLAKYLGGVGKAIHQKRDEFAKRFFDFYHGKLDYFLAGKSQEKQKEVLTSYEAMSIFSNNADKAEFYADKTIQIFAHCAFLLSLFLGASEVSRGLYAPEFYPMLALMVLSAFEGLGGLSSGAKALDYSLSAAKDLSHLKDYDPHCYGKQSLEDEDRTLSFNKVSFSYDKEKPFIKDLSFCFEAGKKIAFVGQSGSGKSTVGKLIMNLWQADGGKRTLGKVAYQDLSRESLWEAIGFLEQKPYLFTASVKENLKLVDKEASDEKLWEVLDLVGLKKTVENFQDGLDEVLGERGEGLSGGEAERLALARLILKNPSIVILDEPYRSLDLGTKKKLKSFIESWTKTKTLIMITHEFKDLEYYDFIYVYQHGSIVECGTHEALLSQNGEYKGFYELEKNRL